MGVTDTFALPFPELDEEPNGPLQVQALAEAIDDVLAGFTGASEAGTYAARPGAGTLAPGTLYCATDTLGVFRTTGAAWVLVAQGRPLVTTAAFSTWPQYDGCEVALQIDATNGVVWVFRYTAGSAHASKWEAVGASTPIEAKLLTYESTPVAAAAFQDPTTPTFVTVPKAGDYIVEGGAGAIDTGTGGAYGVGLKLGAAAPSGDNAAYPLAQSGTSAHMRATATGLAAGDTVRFQVRHSFGAAASTGTYNRYVRVWPRRVTQ